MWKYHGIILAHIHLVVHVVMGPRPHDGMSLVGWLIHVGNCLVDQVGKSKEIKEL
jgi:hypothetical protein